VIVEMSKAVQGALRLDKKFDVIANHLANAGTAGYKAETLSFDGLFQAQMRIDMSQGSVQPTGNPLDLAITGDGFFKVQTPNGDRYTRNGTFLLDKDNYLITQEGYRVLGTNGPLNLEGTRVTVSENGDIIVDGSQVGTLNIVTLADLGKLEKEDAGLLIYKGSLADEREPERKSVQQNAIEQSNVSAVVEMAEMITTSRHFESFQKLIQTYDEMDAKAVSEVGLVR
jgi:flagellar basal-body rod protein FlgG